MDTLNTKKANSIHMNKIQKLSKALHTASTLLVVIILLGKLLFWFLGNSNLLQNMENYGIIKEFKTPEGLIKLSEVHWTLFSKVVVVAGSLLEALPILLGLIILRTIFNNYQVGKIFTPENSKSYGYLGFLFFLSALITKPLSESLKILGVTLTQGPGHRYLTLSFGLPNIEALFCGFVILVISWVMYEGNKLHEETSLTI